MERLGDWARIIVLAVLGGLGAGCGFTHQWLYEKPGMTAESLDRDRAACGAASPAQGLTKLFSTDDIDRDAFTACMQQRGYTARREAR